MIDTLGTHAVNHQRSARGQRPLATITLKWWGRHRPAPTFAHRHGLRGALIGASPFLAGLAETVGLESVRMEETDEPGKDLEARLDRGAALLRAGSTFVLSHQKATDEAGHTKDCYQKVRVLESLDASIARLAEAPFADAVVCVTGDHATPASRDVIHSGDPVPFAMTGPSVRSDAVERFGELWQAGGILGHVVGADVIPLLLNAAGPAALSRLATNERGRRNGAPRARRAARYSRRRPGDANVTESPATEVRVPEELQRLLEPIDHFYDMNHPRRSQPQ